MSHPVRIDVGIKDAITLLVLVFTGIQLNLLLMDQTAMFHHAAASLGINLLVFQMTSQCLIILMVVIVYMFARARSDPSRSWLRELGVIRPAHSALAIGLAGALAAFVFSTLVIFTLHASDSGFAMRRFLGMTGEDRLLFSVCIVLLAPLAEELLYRGAVFSALSRSIGLGISSVVVTGLFVASHYTLAGGSEPASLPSLLQLSMLGVILILVRVRTGDLWACIVAHSVYNALCLVAALAV